MASAALQQYYQSRRQRDGGADDVGDGDAAPRAAAPDARPQQARAARAARTQQREVVPGKVWVGGLSASTDAASLEAAFRPHGEVLDARVLYDGHGAERRPRGYGFVTFAEPAQVAPAMRAMDGAVVDGSTVRINEVFRNDDGAAAGADDATVAPARKKSKPAPQGPLGRDAELDAAGRGAAASAAPLASSSASPVLMVPERHVGLVIGRGGATIRQIRAQSGAGVVVADDPVPVVGSRGGGTGTEQREVRLTGRPHQIEAARELVAQLLAGGARGSSAPATGASQEGPTDRIPSPETIVAAYINDTDVDEGEWW
jgi:hypothetical protein